MRIEHIALYVSDLEDAKNFFLTYFDATANTLYHNTRTGFKSYFLSFSDGSRLEIMTKPELADAGVRANQFGYAHLAFSVGSKDEVDRLTNTLAAQGYQILSGPRITGDGYYESCILAFENNIIEITV